jgi:hypothetical protein
VDIVDGMSHCWLLVDEFLSVEFLANKRIDWWWNEKEVSKNNININICESIKKEKKWPPPKQVATTS